MNIQNLNKKIHEKHNFLFGFVLFAIFCMILFLNCFTPLAADDFSYIFVYGSSDRVNSFADVFRSQWLHYFNWGGRSVVHFIVQTFSWWGKPIFNIFNSIIFVIYICLISFFAFGKKSIKGIICSFLIVWFMLPVISSIIFWLTGSCNYLWGMTIVFLYLYRYYKCILINKEGQISMQNQRESLLLIILWFLYGIIAGWCNENTSGMGILVCCLLTLYEYKRHNKIYRWQIFGIIGAVLGFVLMILAPGNYARADAFDVPSNAIKRLIEGFIRADEKTFMAEGIYGVIFFLFLFTYLFMIIIPTIDKERKIIGGIWFVGALACNYAMALSPYYPDRASCGVYSMCFISIFYAAYALIEFFNQKYVTAALKVVICIGCLYFLVSYLEASYDIGITYLRNNERIEFVLSEKDKGNLDISVPKIEEPKTKYNIYSTVPDWPLFNAQGYFGVNSIETY